MLNVSFCFQLYKAKIIPECSFFFYIKINLLHILTFSHTLCAAKTSDATKYFIPESAVFGLVVLISLIVKNNFA